MKRTSSKAGFTLIELMIVVAIIAIIAAVAIPKLISARISANENAAIATLRSIAAAQQQLQASSAIDTDADGGGEYGFFGELAGADPVRVYNGGAPAVGTAVADVLDPTYLPVQFGNVVDSGAGGAVERQGYYFQMYLPEAGLSPIAGIPEDAAGGNNTLPDPDNAELIWCCYAWPVQTTKTGNRAFFINEQGDVMGTQNRLGGSGVGTVYDAFTDRPEADAAFTVDDDIGSDPALAQMGLTAQDGNVWTPVGN